MTFVENRNSLQLGNAKMFCTILLFETLKIRLRQAVFRLSNVYQRTVVIMVPGHRKRFKSKLCSWIPNWILFRGMRLIPSHPKCDGMGKVKKRDQKLLNNFFLIWPWLSPTCFRWVRMRKNALRDLMNLCSRFVRSRASLALVCLAEEFLRRRRPPTEPRPIELTMP